MKVFKLLLIVISIILILTSCNKKSFPHEPKSCHFAGINTGWVLSKAELRKIGRNHYKAGNKCYDFNKKTFKQWWKGVFNK